MLFVLVGRVAVANKKYFRHVAVLPPYARVMRGFAILVTAPDIPLSMAYLGISWQTVALCGSKNGSKTGRFYYHPKMSIYLSNLLPIKKRHMPYNIMPFRLKKSPSTGLTFIQLL